MKYFKYLMTFLAFAFIIPLLASCGDDDDPGQGEAIKGTYSGTLGYSVMNYAPGDLPGAYDLQIIPDSKEDTKVTVVLPECSFTYPGAQNGAHTIPQLVINDVEVKANGNVYSIEKDDFEIVLDGVKYPGSKLQGTIAGRDIKLEYTLRPGGMPMDLNFSFKGTLK